VRAELSRPPRGSRVRFAQTVLAISLFPWTDLTENDAGVVVDHGQRVSRRSVRLVGVLLVVLGAHLGPVVK